jgi:hypothetical protein
MSKDKGYYHDKGEQDAANGKHDPPHQGPALGKNYWDSDMSGRPVTDKDKQEDYDSYEEGQDNVD